MVNIHVVQTLKDGKQRVLKVGETIIDYVKGRLPRPWRQIKQLKKQGYENVRYEVYQEKGTEWVGKTKLDGTIKEKEVTEFYAGKGESLILQKRPRPVG